MLCRETELTTLGRGHHVGFYHFAVIFTTNTIAGEKKKNPRLDLLNTMPIEKKKNDNRPQTKQEKERGGVRQACARKREMKGKARYTHKRSFLVNKNKQNFNVDVKNNLQNRVASLGCK